MKTLMVVFAILLPLLTSVSDVDKAKAMGNPAAPIQVELFCDFSTPACRTAYKQWIPQLNRDYVTKGQVYLIFREYPLPNHPYCKEAATYAVAAARISKYSQVANALMENQNSWSMTGKVSETVAAVLSPAEQKRVSSLRSDPVVTSEVQRDSVEARAVGVYQVPAIVIIFKTKKQVLNNLRDYNELVVLLNPLLHM